MRSTYGHAVGDRVHDSTGSVGTTSVVRGLLDLLQHDVLVEDCVEEESVVDPAGVPVHGHTGQVGADVEVADELWTRHAAGRRVRTHVWTLVRAEANSCG